ncbi:MAG: protein phosphatase 2C domain-containing protein [Anaerolineae bacterium]|nr:protein phosphatase 2C domain-containing protein [Anaerolineae bacterium]
MSQSSTTTLAVNADMATDPGRRRRQNQDAIGQLTPTDPDVLAQLGRIFVLADGVGGLEGGDLASQYAVSTIISSYYAQEQGDPPERLARAIAEANSVIYAEGHERDERGAMATTVVVAIVRGSDLIIGSVGDSPAYLMRDAQPRKLTLDHNLQTMRREAGDPLPMGHPAGEKLVRALGSMPSVKVDIITGRVRHHDHVILCSDGLTRYADPQEIEATIATLPMHRTARALVDLANERGGADNVSVIVLRLVDEQAPDPGDDLDTAVSAGLDDWNSARNTFDSGGSAAKPGPAGAADNLLLDDIAPPSLLAALLERARGNTVITGIGMGALLVLFVVIMLVVANLGDDESTGGEESGVPPTSAVSAQYQTSTAQAVYAFTQRAMAAGTSDAIQAATAAQSARWTLTPPSPVPTYGPQMESGMWFKVLDGDPIPAYTDPDIESASLADLEADQTFRVMAVDREPVYGPWYQVLDTFGLQARWVNGPDLYGRITAVNTSGNPLPQDQQPPDIAPPYVPTLTPTRQYSPTPLPTLTGTPGTPVTPRPSLTPTPPVAYGVEAWHVGSQVAMKDGLDLCQTPSVQHCDAGQVAAGEIGTVAAGPQESEGHYWWEIEFLDGRRGWIAQVLLGAP